MQIVRTMTRMHPTTVRRNIPDHGAAGGEMRPQEAAVAVTLDLHEGDLPEDITFAAGWLSDAGIRATFFIPSAMLSEGRYAARLRELQAGGHEVASHTHRHDMVESDALIHGGRRDLAFLETSRRLHEDFFGASPTSFRAPGWCALSGRALDELTRLGYSADSSATPQRLSVFGSTPFRGAWSLSPRRLHYLRHGLLEVPTSTAVVPAGSPTFLIFRRRLSLAFIRALLLEARLFPDRVVVVQFHPDDLNPASAQTAPCAARLTPGDFLLRRQGGFGFKHHLKDTDRGRIGETTQTLVRLLAACRCVTVCEVAREVQAASGGLGRQPRAREASAEAMP